MKHSDHTPVLPGSSMVLPCYEEEEEDEAEEAEEEADEEEENEEEEDEAEEEAEEEADEEEDEEEETDEDEDEEEAEEEEDKLSSMEGLKVEWSKKDLNDPVHLYQDGVSQADKQHTDYKERANFFTEHLKDGNFSLRLDKLTAEDEGEYTCTGHSASFWKGSFSTEINVLLKLLGKPTDKKTTHSSIFNQPFYLF